MADKCSSVDSYKEVIDEVDIITYEFEHVFEDASRYAEDKGKLIPGLKAVELKRERWREKKFFKDSMIPTPRFYITEDRGEVLNLIRNEFDCSAVVKLSKGGYNGKG